VNLRIERSRSSPRGGRDLSGFRINAADTLSIAEIAAALGKAAHEIRGGKDPAFDRSRSLIRALPLWAIHMVVGVTSFLANTLKLHLPSLGLPQIRSEARWRRASA